MLSYQIYRFGICVPLTDEQWEKLDNWGYDEELKFIKMLEDVGASKVDCFDQNIFFNVDSKAEAKAVVRKIEELLSSKGVSK
jgi:hypothetical protein